MHHVHTTPMTNLACNEIERRISASCSGYWITCASRLRRCIEALGIDSSRAASVLDYARQHANKGRKGRATNWLSLALLLDQKKTLARLSRNGLIRASSYDYDPTLPRHLAEETLVHARDLLLTAETQSFLRHHLELMTIAPSARDEFTKLLTTMRQEPLMFLRSCIVTLEVLFMRDVFPEIKLSLPWYAEEESKETLAEGFSLLWSNAQEHVGITEMTATLWDTDGVLKGRYYGFLTRAAALRKYEISEILIDAFGYSCTARGDLVAIQAPDAEMEKAKVWGYICDGMRRRLSSQEADETGAVSLRQFGQNIHHLLRHAGMIHSVQGPMRRVRFEYPISQDVFGPLGDPGSFREELSERIEMDYGLATDDVLDFQICDHLKLRDVRAVKRLAFALASCMATELTQWQPQRDVIVNSVVPIFHDSDSLDRVLGIVLQPESARAFRQLFSWQFASDKPEYLDVQYQPVLKVGTEWHVPLSILGSSDLSRAALKLTRKRPGAGQGLLEQHLVQAFEEAHYVAKSEIKLRDGRKTSCEIDVASLIGDTLLILECKDSLIPRSILEMRTSLDACEKAAHQLDRIRATLTDDNQVQLILSNMGADQSRVDHVVTAIVSGNGMFSGMNFGGHLVVSPGHLLNFVYSGEIVIMGHRISTREPGHATSRAMRSFFAGSYYQRAFAAMVRAVDEVELDGKRLRHHTYALDLVELCRRYGVELQPDELSSHRRSSDYSSGRSS